MSNHEPLIHSHVEDELPDEHLLAFTNIDCKRCGRMLHSAINECMQTWVETGKGNYCIKCFAEEPNSDALDDDYGLNFWHHGEAIDKL